MTLVVFWINWVLPYGLVITARNLLWISIKYQEPYEPVLAFITRYKR